jgi:hypothetical protein
MILREDSSYRDSSRRTPAEKNNRSARTSRGGQNRGTELTKPRHSPMKIPRPRSHPLPPGTRPPAHIAYRSDARRRGRALAPKPLAAVPSCSRPPQSQVQPPAAIAGEAARRQQQSPVQPLAQIPEPPIVPGASQEEEMGPGRDGGAGIWGGRATRFSTAA